MKSLVEKHVQAIQLRQQGASYSQIKKKLSVSKSSLSLWLRRYPLSNERIQELRGRNEQRIEKFRSTMRIKRETRLKKVYLQELKRLLPLTERELYIAGLFLYWGEGAKTTHSEISLSNTNPKIVKFFLFWLTHIFLVPKEKIVVRLHLYRDMKKEPAMKFWADILDLPLSQFRSPYIKKTTLRGLTYHGFGHGTCNLIVYGRDISEKVLMGIESIADHFSDSNGKISMRP